MGKLNQFSSKNKPWWQILLHALRKGGVVTVFWGICFPCFDCSFIPLYPWITERVCLSWSRLKIAVECTCRIWFWGCRIFSSSFLCSFITASHWQLVVTGGGSYLHVTSHCVVSHVLMRALEVRLRGFGEGTCRFEFTFPGHSCTLFVPSFAPTLPALRWWCVRLSRQALGLKHCIPYLQRRTSSYS